jgi:hypothetical protein
MDTNTGTNSKNQAQAGNVDPLEAARRLRNVNAGDVAQASEVHGELSSGRNRDTEYDSRN